MTGRTSRHANLYGAPARGLALLEVVVSMMVLTVGIVSVSRTFSVATLARGLAQDYTDSRCLAAQLIWEAVAQAKTLEVGVARGRFGDEWQRFSWELNVSRTGLPYYDPSRTLIRGSVPGPYQRSSPFQTGGAFQMRGSDEQGYPYGTGGPEMKGADVFGRVVVTIRWKRRGVKYERSVATLVAPVVDKGRRVL